MTHSYMNINVSIMTTAAAEILPATAAVLVGVASCIRRPEVRRETINCKYDV